MDTSHPVFAPAGWPHAVRPPGAPHWEKSAVLWLLDLCPPEARGYLGLREEPVVLAAWTRWHVEGSRSAMRTALSRTRADLGDYVSADVVERALRLWQREDAVLELRQREVALVESALRGRRFRPQL